MMSNGKECVKHPKGSYSYKVITGEFQTIQDRRSSVFFVNTFK